jgi:hypothetical protein
VWARSLLTPVGCCCLQVVGPAPNTPPPLVPNGRIYGQALIVDDKKVSGHGMPVLGAYIVMPAL